MSDNQLLELTKEEIEDIVNEYKEVFQNSVTLESVFIRKSTVNLSRIVLTEWKQRNLERGTNTKILRTILSDGSFTTGTVINTEDVSNRIMRSISKSEKYKAVISSIPKKKPKMFLEIWDEAKCLMVFDFTALEAHGAVYSDEIFGCLSWSPLENKVAYVAEKNLPKSAPFYQQRPKKDPTDDNKGTQHVFYDDWGEQMTPKSHPVIAVCDIVEKNISILEGVPDDVCVGQVVWDPSGQGLVGVAIKSETKRLGIKFCTNRQFSIFYLALDGTYKTLSDESKSSLSPRFSPNGEYLIWLQQEKDGPHLNNSALVKCEWSTKKISTLVDIVENKRITNNGKTFHGIYAISLPVRCWSSDSKYIVLDSLVKNYISTYIIDIDDGSLWDINPSDCESLSFLDISEDNYIACCKSSFKQPSTLLTFHLSWTLSGIVTFKSLTPSIINDENTIQTFIVYDLKSGEARCTATYFGPKSDENDSIPLILLPHGGPHGVISNFFNSSLHFFSKLKFGTLLVHYRGSLGFGKKFVEILPGHVGSMDVDDCYAAVQTALQKFSWLDKNNVILYGGSHGGFLATHLSGQYPDIFLATIAINPVTNIPAMVYVTDIPDWTVVESGYPYLGLTNVMDNPDLYAAMADKSPIKYVKKVKSPTLLLIGKNDLRVPPSQGISYYNMLKEMKVPTKMMLYDDNHSLSSIPVEMDRLINSVIWIKRCIKQNHH